MLNKIGKIYVVVVIIVLTQGCALTRKRERQKVLNDSSTGLLMEVRSNNIGKRAFVIQKFSVRYRLKGESRKFSGNLKHDRNGDILMSVRMPGGIEVARIYFGRDSVMINDRINRVYRSGSTNIVFEKYGFTFNDLNMIFGDISDLVSSETIVLCDSGFTEINYTEQNGNIIITKIDCSKKKVAGIKIYDNQKNIVYSIVYDKMDRYGSSTLAEKIYVEYPKIGLAAEIELKGFVLVDVVSMKFKRGHGYKYQLLK